MAALDPTSKTIASYPRNGEMPEFVFMKEGTGARATIVAQRIIGTDSVVESYALDKSYQRIDAIPISKRSSSEQMVRWLVRHDYIPIIRNDRIFFEPMQEIPQAALSHQNQTANNPSIELSLTFPTFFGTDVPATEFQRAFIAEQEAALQPGGDQIKLEAIRRCFEGYLGRIAGETQGDEQLRDRSCFICFNFSEEDVRSCVGKFLMGDLEKVGLKVYCSRKDLGPGKSISNFQANISRATVVLLVCTPEGKIKVDERDARGTREGIADEIKLLRTSFQAGRQEGTVFLTFVKGGRNNACLYDQFLDAMDRKMHHAAEYYESAIELYGVMRGLKLEDSSGLQGRFITDALSILSGTTLPSREEINLWKRSIEPKWLERERRVRELMDYPLATLQAHLKEFYGAQTIDAYRVGNGWDWEFPLGEVYTSLEIVKTEINKLKEGVVTHSKQFIPLADLLKKIRNFMWKQAVILGAAGVGKTTICEMIAMRGDELCPEFSVIFLIKLANLNESRYPPTRSYTIYDILAKECGFEQDLYYYQDMLEDPNFRNKILLVLDGFDELPMDAQKDGSVLAKIFHSFGKKFPHSVITSRPNMIGRNPECEYEITGFNRDSIKTYVSNFFAALIQSKTNPITPDNAERKRDKLLTILDNHVTLQSLVYTPINLALVCSLFNEDEVMFESNQNFSTTEIYTKTVEWHFKCFLLRRQKQGDCHEPIMRIRASTDVLERPGLTPFISALGRIAWNAIETNTHNPTVQDIKEILHQQDLNVDLLVDLGIFNIDSWVRVGRFAHSTFREYFAALHLARYYCKGDFGEAKKIVRKIKFDPRYRLVLSMTAGYLSLRENQEALQKFFDHLFGKPRDRATHWELIFIGECFAQCKNPRGIRQYPSFLHHCRRSIHRSPNQIAIIELLFQDVRLCYNQEIVSLIVSEMSHPKRRDKILMALHLLVVKNRQILPPQFVSSLLALLKEPANDRATSASRKGAIDLLGKIVQQGGSNVGEIIDHLKERFQNAELDERFAISFVFRKLITEGEPISGKVIEVLVRDLLPNENGGDAAVSVLTEIPGMTNDLSKRILAEIERLIRSRNLEEHLKRVVAFLIVKTFNPGEVLSEPMMAFLESMVSSGLDLGDKITLISDLVGKIAQLGGVIPQWILDFLEELSSDSALDRGSRIKASLELAKITGQEDKVKWILVLLDELFAQESGLSSNIDDSILQEMATRGVKSVSAKIIDHLVKIIKLDGSQAEKAIGTLVHIANAVKDKGILNEILEHLYRFVQGQSLNCRKEADNRLSWLLRENHECVQHFLREIVFKEVLFPQTLEEFFPKFFENFSRMIESGRLVEWAIAALVGEMAEFERTMSDNILDHVQRLLENTDLSCSLKERIANELLRGMQGKRWPLARIAEPLLDWLTTIIGKPEYDETIRQKAAETLIQILKKGGDIPKEVHKSLTIIFKSLRRKIPPIQTSLTTSRLMPEQTSSSLSELELDMKLAKLDWKVRIKKNRTGVETANKLWKLSRNRVFERSAFACLRKVVNQGGAIPQTVVVPLVELLLSCLPQKNLNDSPPFSLPHIDSPPDFLCEILKRENLISIEVLQILVHRVLAFKKYMLMSYLICQFMREINLEVLGKLIVDQFSCEIVQHICFLSFRSFVIANKQIYLSDDHQRISRPCPPEIDTHILEIDRAYCALPSSVSNRSSDCTCDPPSSPTFHNRWMIDR